MPDYQGLAITAKRLIEASGVSAIVRRHAGSTHDPVTGASTGGDWDDQMVQAVFLPPTGPAEQYVGINLDADIVQDVIIAGYGLEWEPAPLDQISYRGSWWVLHALTCLSPNGAVPMLFRGWAVVS
jgi:hypothetical protein